MLSLGAVTVIVQRLIVAPLVAPLIELFHVVVVVVGVVVPIPLIPTVTAGPVIPTAAPYSLGILSA